MQAARNVLKLLLLVTMLTAVASLGLVACSGAGDSGVRSAQWFNLPSIPLDVAADGSTSVLGFPVNPNPLPASLVQQLQGANVQRAEVRVGADGVYIFSNGEDLPFLDWNDESVDTVQRLIETQPVRELLREEGVTEDQVNLALPWLRRIGLGAALNVSPAEGETLAVDSWDGRVLQPGTVEPAEGESAIAINSLAFDPESGEASFGSIPLSQIDPSLGSTLTLDENTRGLISALNAESLQVGTGPNGINLALGEQPLPGIAYDAESLQRALALVPALGLVDPSLNETLQQFGPQLATTQLDLGVSFTGQPLGETDLSDLTVNLGEDGSLSALGFPVSGAGTVDAQLLATLSEAGVQQLRIDLANDGLTLLTNDGALPRLTWTPESLGTVAQIVAPLAGVAPETITSAVAVASESNVGATVNLPGAEGSAPPAGEVTFAAPDIAPISAPVLRIDAAYSGSDIQSLGPISGAELEEAGIASSLSLPPNVVQALQTAGASSVEITSDPNVLNLLIDGSNALSIQHDAASLTRAFRLALPFLDVEALSDPAVQQLLIEQILPLVPAADLDVTVNLE